MRRISRFKKSGVNGERTFFGWFNNLYFSSKHFRAFESSSFEMGRTCNTHGNKVNAYCFIPICAQVSFRGLDMGVRIILKLVLCK